MTSLADRQAALVAALTAGAPTPPGFDTRRLEVARIALLRKRSGEVARHWPLLAATLGPAWTGTFTEWAATRPTRGSLRDGWDLARALAAAPGGLEPAAAIELATREVGWRYDGRRPPRRRRAPAARRAGGALVVQCLGRVTVIGRAT